MIEKEREGERGRGQYREAKRKFLLTKPPRADGMQDLQPAGRIHNKQIL